MRGSTWQPDAEQVGDDVRPSLEGPREACGACEDLKPAPPVVRSFFLRKSGFVTRGYTPYCKSCVAMRLEKALQGDSDERHARVVGLLKQRPEIRMRQGGSDDAADR